MSWSFSSSSRAAFFRAAGPAAVVADWPASSPLPELPSGKRAIWSSGVKAGVDFEALPVRKLFASGTSAAPRSSTAIEMAGQFGIRTRAGRTRRLPVFYDAETPVNRYPEGFGRSFRKAEQTHQNLAGDGWLWTLGQSLSRNDLHAVAVDLHWQERGAGAHDCFLHMGAPLRLNQQHDAATAARSADFASERAFAPGFRNDAVDHGCRNRGQIAFAEGPFGVHQAAGVAPVRRLEGLAHLLSDFGDALEVAANGLVAVGVRLEDFPVVDAGLARLAGVANNEPPLEFIEVDAQFDAMLAAGRQFDRGGASEGRRIVILGSGWHTNDNGLGIAADVNPIDFALARSREAIERGTDGNGHGTGAANPRASGGFGIRRELEAAPGLKELHDFGKQGQAVTLRLHQSTK